MTRCCCCCCCFHLSTGGWPLVGIDSNRSGPWDINDPNGFLNETLYGSGAFFRLDVISNPHNSSRNVLAVSGRITTYSRQKVVGKASLRYGDSRGIINVFSYFVYSCDLVGYSESPEYAVLSA